MRRLLLSCVAVASVLALAAVSTAAAPLIFFVQPDNGAKAGTPAKPRPVALLFTSNDKKARSAVLRKVTFYFDRNLVFRGGAVPQCRAAVAIADSADCDNTMLVGETPAAFGGRSWAKIYNGPGGKTLIFEAYQGTKYYTVVGRLLSAGKGAFGKRLVIPIPDFLVQPRPTKVEGFLFWLGNATQTRKAPYLGLKGCKGGQLRFKVSYAYKNAATRTDTAGMKCST